VIDLAYAMAPSPGGTPSGPGAILIQLVPFALVLAIFFFLLIRPQQRERKRREEMLAALKKGDRVVTSGGLVGTIVSVSEQTVQLKIADSVRVECLRSAVTGLRTESKADGGSA
jgi:preprotein translocase subunit YajC